jgi:hypothetical protein
MLLKEKRFGLPYAITVALIVLLLLWLAARTFGQTDTVAQTKPSSSATQELEPVFSDYKGIRIGTTATEVLKLVDKKPTFEDKNGYFFIFNNGESAQVVLDVDRKVKIISVTYLGKDADPPAYTDVFGDNVPIKKNAEGKIYNVVNYRQAGFWVSYYGSMEKEPMTTITVQKLPNGN